MADYNVVTNVADIEDLFLAAFLAKRSDSGYLFSATDGWIGEADLDIDIKVLPNLPGKVIARHRQGEHVLYLIIEDKKNGVLAHCALGAGRVAIQVAAASDGAPEAFINILHELHPDRVIKPQARQITMNFRYCGTMGGSDQITRVIDAPYWNEIADNYPTRTREHLETLMNSKLAPEAGQLILWQGVPGTGKTYALRALAREIGGWCTMEYIIDPDRFLSGDGISYLLETILEDDDAVTEDGEPRWKLLVLEDSGELISKSAREQTGQAVSRLLNIVDGILGQGLRVFVLVTTNEELEDLHEAITRPGRCLAQVRFDSFTRDDSAMWLKQHGYEKEAGVKRAFTLAELYAKLSESTNQTAGSTARPFGFVG